MITIEANVLKCWAAITIPNNQIIIINNIEPICQKCWAAGLDEAMSSKLYYHYQSECLKNTFLFKIITKVLKTLGRRRLQSPRDGGISSQLVVQPLVVVQPLIMLNPATTGFLFKTLMSMCHGLHRTDCHQSFQFISCYQLVAPPYHKWFNHYTFRNQPSLTKKIIVNVCRAMIYRTRPFATGILMSMS